MRNLGRLALWILILTVAVVLRDVTAGARYDQMAPAAPLELGDRGSDDGNDGNDDEGSDLPEVLLAEYFDSDQTASEPTETDSDATTPKSAEGDGYTETVTVTASRTPISRKEIGSSITVIERAEIEARQSFFLGDLLRGVPGLTISRSGAAGSLTQVRVRGAEANQVLVLIDGVAVNDVFAGDEIPLELLTSYDINRIEVVRGPQSGLWGSDALAGVINIITQDPGQPARQEAQLEAGSFGTMRGGGRLALSTQNVRLSVTGSYLETDGTNVSRVGNEDDGASNATATARFGWDAQNHPVGFEILGRYTDANSEFDAIDFVSTGLPTDDDRSTETELALLNASGHWAPSASAWRHELKVSLVSSDTESFTAATSAGSTAMDKRVLSLQSSVALGSDSASLKQDLTVALNHDVRQFRQRGSASPFGDPNQNQDMETTGAALEYRVRLPERWSLSASLRHDRNSDFEDATTYRATTSYSFSDGGTRLRASIGTGQKPPTFIERYGFFPDSFIGNPGLKPETSTGWDIGLDQRLGQESRLELTYFRDRLKDEINGFVFDLGLGALTAENESGVSQRQGVEFALRAALGEQTLLSTTYTYTDATQPSGAGGDDEELRRPRHTANATLHYSPRRVPVDFLLNRAYIGSQVDLFFPPFPQPQQRVRLDSYLLADVTVRSRIGKRVELFGRVENALDEQYEDVYGFATPGIGAYVGIRFFHDSKGRGVTVGE